MFKKILLPYDGLDTTLASVRYSIRLSKKIGAKLYFVHVIDKNTLDSAKQALKDIPVKKRMEYIIEEKALAGAV